MPDMEMQTIISNIDSLLEQLKQMSGGGAEEIQQADDIVPKPEDKDVPPEMMEKVLKILKEMDEDKKDEVEKTDDEDKDDLQKSDEGTTANDKAEAVVDDQGEENEKNINEVAKAIVMALRGKKVQKSKQSNSLSELCRVVKIMADEISEVKKAQESLITEVSTGLGIADKIIGQNPVRSSRPVNDIQELQKSLEYIRGQVISEKKQESEQPDAHYLAKTLAEGDGAALRAIFTKNKR